ncbi:hypothetical protein OCF54_18940 [Bacillus tropicus]|nr:MULTISPECIES: hypothetical protein [Bacillus cereus group]MCU5224845.1 hypothetical protein [Bacillus tropicus]MBR9746088.1 hypothetical protein [Bacillus cereus]MDA1643668.1 hypothetical protein [Bacillus cereus group sp. TH163-1LC]MDA1793173.1 hypothetical protein [Bacillus cereus group sp. BY8-1LC]MDA1880017.1 hypothetical protein [Bacillus cereus group sp. BY10-2LC]
MELKTSALGYAAIGVGTTAVSAFAGAKVGAAVGTVAGACIGLGVSIGASIVTDGIKFNKGDWNHDGKQDSIKDKVKTGIGVALDKIF